MPQKSKDSVHILEGRATLYKRELTPHWQVLYNVLWEVVATNHQDRRS